MADTIPDLWSDDISVKVLSPLAILRAQAGPLAQKTRGLLQVQIETTETTGGRLLHQFDLVATALNNFRRRILIAKHHKDLVYPVIIEAECFIPEGNDPIASMAQRMSTLSFQRTNQLAEGERRAVTAPEFIDLVGEVLHSFQVRALIQSLIARSNDQIAATEPASPSEAESAE